LIEINKVVLEKKLFKEKVDGQRTLRHIISSTGLWTGELKHSTYEKISEFATLP